MTSARSAGQSRVTRLLYAGISSLDGYVADRDGSFDWSAPDEEVHAYVNDLQRPCGLHLYGRRMYEVLQAWETLDLDGQSAAMVDYAHLWRAADKVVYSRTLPRVASARTRIEREFDIAGVRRLKESAGTDLTIGGPGLAAAALRGGLVDEISQLLSPVVVGGGTPFLPEDLHLALDLVDERRFGNGVVGLRYRVR